MKETVVKMKHRKSTPEDKRLLIDYAQEHYLNRKMSITASNGITIMEYVEWLEKLKQDETGENKK